MSDQEKAVKDKLARMPGDYKKRYRLAMSGKSRKAAMDSFCFECVGWRPSELKDHDCTSLSCPLYPYRPFGSGGDEIDLPEPPNECQAGKTGTRTVKPLRDDLAGGFHQRRSHKGL